MLSKIKVYGRLARFLGERTFEAEVRSPIEAFKFLVANFPNLESHVVEQNYCIKVGNYEISDKELDIPVGNQEIKIVPIVTGARGVGKFLLGAILIGVAIAAPAAGLGLGSAKGSIFFGTTGGGALAAAAGNLGIYLALSGAAEMISPTPTPSSSSDDPTSFTFNGIINTVRSGVPIPVVYGEIFCGSLVVSAGIDTDDFSG
tara:strand:+ start:1010 stop:1615 length:606 start_codon:yes stop_codon:yes gene_type:complete